MNDVKDNITPSKKYGKKLNKYEIKAGYELSENQIRFCKKAEKDGFGKELRFTYSGRGMFGEKCPAVSHDHGAFGCKGASQDQLGLGAVTYMPR